MDEQGQLNLLFFALSDATRRDMLSRLVREDASITALAEHYEASLPAISKHLRVLEDAGLVRIDKAGRSRIVSLEPENLRMAQIWLSTLNDESLIFDQLEAEIESWDNASSET